MPDFISIIINNGIGVGCAAAVLWLAWYRETKTLPYIMRTMSDTHEQSQIHFNTRHTTSLDTFSTLIREERQLFQQWHQENRSHLDRLTEEVKENRHLMKNLSHQLGMQKAVEREQDKQRQERDNTH